MRYPWRGALPLLALLANCAGTLPSEAPKAAEPPATRAAKSAAPAATTRTLRADTVLERPSGASFKAAAGWTVSEAADRVTLVSPEGDLRVVYLEVEAEQRAEALERAWQRVAPGFALEVEGEMETPAHDGWEQVGQTSYVTAEAEQRGVVAAAAKLKSKWYVFLFDGKLAAFERRGVQLGNLLQTLTVPGLDRESFAGRKPQQLDAARLAELERFIQEAMKLEAVPGVALAIVQGDRVVLERAWGVRELGKPNPVTPATRFLVASITKPLTTLLMARLVDDKKLGWDTPLGEILPSFVLGDSATTRAVTVRHSVCACTGMPPTDLPIVFEFAKSTPEGRLADLASMQPTTGFGETFQYSNYMVTAGGYAVAHAFSPEQKLGPAYDRAMRELVFAPLGMNSTGFDFDEFVRSNHAMPHGYDLHGKPVALPLSIEEMVVAMRPSMGAWSTMGDLVRVLRLELANGVLDGRRVFSAANLLERRKHLTKIADHAFYGMGLLVGWDHGAEFAQHTGTAAGFTSLLSFLPQADVGMVLLTNAADAGRFIDAVERRLMELLYAGRPRAERELAAWHALDGELRTKEWSRIQTPPDPAWFSRLSGHWFAPELGRITLRRVAGKALLDAGEWKLEVAQKTDENGTVKLITTGAPYRLELVPTERNGKLLLLLDAGQHSYAFEREGD